MARFYGEVGYGIEEKVGGGKVEQRIVKRNYTGDIQRLSRTLENGDKVNNDITVAHSISILADAFATENFLAIKYVNWAGAYWTVAEVTVERPRLIFRLGGVYNGPKA